MSRMTRPVCAVHGVVMRVEKNDARVRIDADFGPYEVHSGDLWICPVGDERIIVGWGHGPLAQHFEPDFAAFLEDVDVVVAR